MTESCVAPLYVCVRVTELHVTGLWGGGQEEEEERWTGLEQRNKNPTHTSYQHSMNNLERRVCTPGGFGHRSFCAFHSHHCLLLPWKALV